MLKNPWLHIQTTDRPYLGLFLRSDQLILNEHFTRGRFEVKITNKPRGE
jgi:hypothetical protein